MSRARGLFVVAGIALVVWAVSVGLFAHLSSYDPYGWERPGVESVRSRNLWLARRDLYVRVGVASFSVAVLAGAAGLLARRRRLR